MKLTEYENAALRAGSMDVLRSSLSRGKDEWFQGMPSNAGVTTAESLAESESLGTGSAENAKAARIATDRMINRMLEI
jgi:hypothetical protein